MSFHGGLVGVLLAGWIFSRRNGLDPLRVGDAVACATPIGLFLGRLANFVNSELWGRVTDVPWAFVFPNGGPLDRKSVVWGKSVSDRVDLGGRGIIHKTNNKT